jgi:hypothetical protein
VGKTEFGLGNSAKEEETSGSTTSEIYSPTGILIVFPVFFRLKKQIDSISMGVIR